MSKKRSSLLPPDGAGALAAAPCWTFGAFCLDEASRELRRGDTRLKLEPKPLELLMLLLRHAGELVTKDELIETIWQGRVVTENVIFRCVTKLREALGEEGTQRIVTVHGYGYRFAGDCACRVSVPTMRRPQALGAGDSPPGRPQWRLEAPLNEEARVWRATHTQTNQRRVFKFAYTADELAALRRELTLHRVLAQAPDGRARVTRILDSNLEQVPPFLELEYEPLGSLQDWLAAQGGASAVPLEQRLELLAQVAAAVAEAHAVGVLHKDLKPANVLLRADGDGLPQVRLADFGSGRVDAARLEQLQITRLGFTQTQLADSGGTPLYLAPELLSGAVSTTRSDIYALGVMLYQLVVADLRRPLGAGWERDVADPLLREDIALAADLQPEHRLGDAAGLAERLRSLAARREARERQRQREAEQLAALHAGQRARRAMARLRRRRRWLGALVASLSLGLTLSLALFWRAHRAEQRAELEAATLQTVNRFLHQDLLGGANPYVPGGGASVTVASLLDGASSRLDTRFADRPELRVRLANTIAEAYAGLGLEDAARAVLAAALPAADEHRDSGRALMRQLAGLDLLLSRQHEARALYERLERWASAHLAEDAPERLELRGKLAWARFEEGYFAEAKTAFERLRADLARQPGLTGLLRRIDAALVEVYMETQDWALAERGVDALIADITRQQGAESIELLWPSLSKVYLLRTLERWDEAESLARAVQTRAGERLGENHPITIATLNHLGTIRLRQHRYAEARGYFTDALARYRAIFGQENYRTWRVLNRIGEADTGLGRAQAARVTLDEALARSAASLGEDHPHTLDIARLAAEAYAADGAAAEAEARFRRVLELAPRRMPPNNNRTVWTYYGLGRLLLAQGRSAEAAGYLRRARELFGGNFGAQHGMTLSAAGLLQQAGETTTAQNRRATQLVP